MIATPGTVATSALKKGALLASILFLGGSALAAPLSSELTTKCDDFIQRHLAKPGNSRLSVVLQLDGGTTPQRVQRLRSLGAQVYRKLPIIDAVAVTATERNLHRIAALPYVERVSSDTSVVKNDEFVVESSMAGAATAAYPSLNGAGVTVAVLDSGIRDHEDLDVLGGKSSRVIASVNFTDSKTTDDRCGHGTHVAGIVAGNGSSSTGKNFFRTFTGVATGTKLVNVKVLGDQGEGSISSVISGIDWCIKNKSKYNIRIMNLSLGHPVGESYTTDPLCKALERAWKSGIFVVCTAGNTGRTSDTVIQGRDNEGYGAAYGSIQSPGNSPFVMTVGATKSVDGDRRNDRIATYSGRGPSRLDFVMKPDIVAPGNRVISTLANNGYLDKTYEGNRLSRNDYKVTGNSKDSATYYYLSGTSMAAPVVSGAAAMLLQKDPTLSPDTLKARLMLSADKWSYTDGTVDPCTYGAGYLNVLKALQSTVVANDRAVSPTLTRNADGTVTVNIAQTAWGTGRASEGPEVRAIWGTGFAGAREVAEVRAIWGTGALWLAEVSDELEVRAIWGTWGQPTAEVSDEMEVRAIWGTGVWKDLGTATYSSTQADLSTSVIYGEK